MFFRFYIECVYPAVFLPSCNKLFIEQPIVERTQKDRVHSAQYILFRCTPRDVDACLLNVKNGKKGYNSPSLIIHRICRKSNSKTCRKIDMASTLDICRTGRICLLCVIKKQAGGKPVCHSEIIVLCVHLRSVRPVR